MSQFAHPTFQLSLADDLGELGRLSQWVEQISQQVQASARDHFRIELALTEAVTNVMMYGLPPASPKNIRLEASCAPTSVQVLLLDDGIPFDPLSGPVKPKAASLQDATPGGLGLVLIRAYCDQAHYERCDNQNRLSLRFLLEQPAQAASA